MVDQLVVGGGIANTFIAANGHNVGKSLYEEDLIDNAKALSAKTNIPVPTDVVVGKEFFCQFSPLISFTITAKGTMSIKITDEDWRSELIEKGLKISILSFDLVGDS